MDENLVGYLLKALDADTQTQVERHLARDAAARRRLQLLRQAVDPLAADAEAPEPPPDLWLRTVRRVEKLESKKRPVPFLPRTNPAMPRAWWRPPDVLVAATILLALLSLVPAGIVSVQRQRDRLACQDNLRVFHRAVMQYCDFHGDNLPKVEADPPHNFAGSFVPMLQEAGVLSGQPRLTCSTDARQPPRVNAADLDDIQQRRPGEFHRLAKMIGGGYAYPLGFRDPAGHLQGLRREPGSDLLPIMADIPPFEPQTLGQPLGNSLNHGGVGQNVLCLGGNVVFTTHRNVGIDGDDIYLNKRNRVAAGINRWDTVLGASAARPVSPWDE